MTFADGKEDTRTIRTMTRRGALGAAALLILPMPALAQERPVSTVRPVAGRPRVGEVTGVRGQVQVRHGADAPRNLSILDPLRRDDLLTTGPTARLSALLSGGIGLQLGERATLRLDHHVLGGPDAGTALRVSDGALLYEAPAVLPAPVSIAFPQARLGVRATRFFAGPLEGRFAVFVSNGTLDVDAGDRRVELAEGEGTTIDEVGAAVERVIRWLPERIEQAFRLFG